MIILNHDAGYYCIAFANIKQHRINFVKIIIKYRSLFHYTLVMDSVSDNKTRQSEELEILQAVYPDLIEMYFLLFLFLLFPEKFGPEHLQNQHL